MYFIFSVSDPFIFHFSNSLCIFPMMVSVVRPKMTCLQCPFIFSKFSAGTCYFHTQGKQNIFFKRRPSLSVFQPEVLMLTACFLPSSSKGHLSEGYGQLCSIYLKLLRTKMEYHTKVSLSAILPALPATLTDHPALAPGAVPSPHLAGFFGLFFMPGVGSCCSSSFP